MTTLKNMFCWLTWQQFRTFTKNRSSSYWICKFTLPDFGIETNKLTRYLAVTRLDETTILKKH
ncbi:hypothetical protein Avbf_18887, partial [Armadillidium vulgare]